MQGKKREKFAVEACNFTVFMHGTCIYMYVGGVYIHGFYDTRGHTNVLVFHLKKYFCCTGTCFKRREDLRFSKVLLQVCLALYPPGIEATRLHTMIYCVCVCVCVCLQGSVLHGIFSGQTTLQQYTFLRECTSSLSFSHICRYHNVVYMFVHTCVYGCFSTSYRFSFGNSH